MGLEANVISLGRLCVLRLNEKKKNAGRMWNKHIELIQMCFFFKDYKENKFKEMMNKSVCLID